MHNNCPKDVHSSDVKAVPRSDVMCFGMPNLAIHPESMGAVQEAEVASGTGTASSHLVVWSMMVNI